MIGYVKLESDGSFTELVSGDTVCYMTVPIPVAQAAQHSVKTGVYALSSYDEDTVYPANYSITDGVLGYDLIPVSWKYPDRQKRVVANQYILFSDLGDYFGNILTLASLRGLPIDLNDQEYISIIYLNDFNPPKIETDIMALGDKYFNIDADSNISISDTKEDDTWSSVYGDPHTTGLIFIEDLGDM